MKIPIMAEMASEGKVPDVLFWVGCSGSFSARAQKVTQTIVRILEKCDVSYAILGDEEQCSGDPARRAGNEFVFQMLALQNIQTLNGYQIKKIVTACPHCFNTIKNEYPDLGGHYDVIHHTQLIHDLIRSGRLVIADGGPFKGQKITYHDSCYLGRVHGYYEIPRSLIQQLDTELVEMKSCASKGLCCGAGGAQMFKEDEPGDRRINDLRSDEAIATGASVVATNCPYCLTMMTDGLKDKDEKIMVYDLAELILEQSVFKSDEIKD